MKKITLYDLVGTAIILDYPTGIIYSNQTGGTSCLQPEAEGALIPIGNNIMQENDSLYSPENELIEYFSGPTHKSTGATNGLSVEDADKIDGILKKYDLHNDVKVDRSKLKLSHEAWVHVVVYPNSKLLISDQENKKISGILTWCNSD